MIWLAAAAMAAACATGECTEQVEPAAVIFEPLKGREKVFERLGPVGPFYPEAAARRGVTGFAVIDCKVGDGGMLKNCKPVEESPKGENFGAAAQVMAMRKRIRAAEPYTVGQSLKVWVPFEIRP
jgi:TonB family protein